MGKEGIAEKNKADLFEGKCVKEKKGEEYAYIVKSGYLTSYICLCAS